MAADLRKAIVRPRGGFVHYPSQEPQAQDDAGNGAVPEKKRRVRPAGLRRFVLPVCGVLVLALLMGFGMLYYSRVHGRIVMPALIGMPQAQAVSAVRECGVQDVAVVNAYSDEFEAGQVMLQSRAEGERLTAETTVTLTVSLGSQWYELPRMVGWNATEAIAKLADAGANDVRVEYVQSDQPSGIVLSQSEAPGRTSRDTPVVLRVSGQSVAVPSLMGLTLEGAQAVIEAEGLNLGNVSRGRISGRRLRHRDRAERRTVHAGAVGHGGGSDHLPRARGELRAADAADGAGAAGKRAGGGARDCAVRPDAGGAERTHVARVRIPCA